MRRSSCATTLRGTDRPHRCAGKAAAACLRGESTGPDRPPATARSGRPAEPATSSSTSGRCRVRAPGKRLQVPRLPDVPDECCHRRRQCGTTPEEAHDAIVERVGRQAVVRPTDVPQSGRTTVKSPAAPVRRRWPAPRRSVCSCASSLPGRCPDGSSRSLWVRRSVMVASYRLTARTSAISPVRFPCSTLINSQRSTSDFPAILAALMALAS